MKNNLTCIIPFYNEDVDNLQKIIRILSCMNQINNIVVIDDGSDSAETYNFLKNNFSYNPNIKIARLARNYGKSFAIKFGLSFCFNQNVLLLDADLKNLDIREIYNAIMSFRLLELDMVVLRNVNSSPLIKLIRADTLLSGQRIIKKTHLSKILKSGIEGYELELSTNQYFIDNNLWHKCKWSPSSALNNYKYRKHGFFKGIFKDLKMYYEIINYVGFGNFRRQILGFCKQKV